MKPLLIALALILSACAPAGSKGLLPASYGPDPVIQGVFTSGAYVVEIRQDGAAHVQSNGYQFEWSSSSVGLDQVSKREGTLYLTGCVSTTKPGYSTGPLVVMTIPIDDISSDAACVKFALGEPGKWFCK